jgi:hypothetical protein
MTKESERRFRFKREWSLSDVFSAIAIVISVVALLVSYSASRSDVSVEDIGVRHLSVAESPNLLIGAIPLVIRNSGGRTVSLERIIHSDTPIAVKLEYGAEFVDDPFLQVSYGIVDGAPRTNDEFVAMLGDTEIVPLVFPQVLIRHIGPGESLPITLFFIVRESNGDSLNDVGVALSADLLFSDGATHRLAAIFNHESQY